MSGSDVVTDAVIAGSGAGELEDAIKDSKRKKRNRKSAFTSPTPEGVCSNCETKLAGPVCHSCGQTADTFHRPVWDLVMEVLDGLFGIEGRLWRTIPPLMFRPGWLTRQYLSGVRARFVMPFRLYLTASVLFFLLMFSVNSGDQLEAPVVDPASLEEAREDLSGLSEELEEAGIPEGAAAAIQAQAERGLDRAVVDAEAVNNDPDVRQAVEQGWKNEAQGALCAALTPEDCPEQVDTLRQADQDPDQEGVQFADGVSMDFSGLEDAPYGVREFIREKGDSIIEDNGEELMQQFRELLPRVMFVMLPVYAFLLAATHFYKRGYFFYDHLVVSLHFHAFLFFFFILMMLTSLVIGIGWSIVLLLVWSNYYLYRIHRVVYSHGRFSSVLRTIFMDFAYLIFLLIGALVAMFIAFLQQGS